METASSAAPATSLSSESSVTSAVPASSSSAEAASASPETSASAESSAPPETSASVESTSSSTTSSPSSTSASAESTSSSTSATSSVPETSSSSSTSSSATASASSSSGGGTVGGQRFGITYSPYTSNGACKSAGDVSSDIANIKKKGFANVRIYSTDCKGLENVGNAVKENGLKLIPGAYISNSGIGAAQQQVDAIAKWAQWDIVKFIVIGNEAINSGYTDAGSLAGLIHSAKDSFKKAGYSGAVTTTDTLNVWQSQGKALCDAVDVVGANLHPYFSAQTPATAAGEFVTSELKILGGICPNKETFNLETGWPNGGGSNGKAIASTIEQGIALKAIDLAAGHKSVFFSYQNDPWKGGGVEGHWGCIQSFT